MQKPRQRVTVTSVGQTHTPRHTGKQRQVSKLFSFEGKKTVVLNILLTERNTDQICYRNSPDKRSKTRKVPQTCLSSYLSSGKIHVLLLPLVNKLPIGHLKSCVERKKYLVCNPNNNFCQIFHENKKVKKIMLPLITESITVNGKSYQIIGNFTRTKYDSKSALFLPVQCSFPLRRKKKKTVIYESLAITSATSL